MSWDEKPLQIETEAGPLSADLTLPDRACALLVLAHGAGAGYRHANMVAISGALAQNGVASLRFNFPFTEQGRRRVDPQALATRTIADAWAAARALDLDLPGFLGGHSYGGRMASHAVLDHGLTPCGLVFCAFPLHPAGNPGTQRAQHLARLSCPMLFLSGTRDALATPSLLSGCVAELGSRARLHWLEDADHGYRVRKRVRKDPRGVFEEMGETVRRFVLAASRP
jgi:predicted alpha/beta-hydrolase family hydrolase